jgi:hypothetical protein
MVHTAIGIFPTHSHAQEATRRLVAEGFDRQFINVTSRNKTDKRSDFFDEDDNPSYTEQLRKYFRDIFQDAEDVESYSRAAYNGVLVSAQTDNYGQAERAAEIMDECGTIYIESKAHALKHGYNEHERLNSVDDREDQVASTETSGSDESRVDTQQRSSPSGTIKIRRTYIADTSLNGDLAITEEHIKIETIPADTPIRDRRDTLE